MQIFIPTRGRPNHQPTAEALTAAGIEFRMVCSLDDDTLVQYLNRYGRTVRVVGTIDISEKRQAIVRLNRRATDRKILMLDDDLRFYTRKRDGKFRKSTVRDIVRMLSKIAEALNEHAHVGLVDKFMSQNQPRGVKHSGRYNQVLGYNLAMWPRGVKFRLPINEEHDVHLQLSQSGLRPCVLCEYSKDGSYYSKGGCSSWRTPHVEMRSMKEMARLWPDYVSIREHQTNLSGYSLWVKWSKVDG
jgi:hypothetical protein